MNNPVFGGTLNPMGTLSGGLRPGTNMMMRPGSQMRPGSTRMQAVGVGGSLQQPIAVTAAAPITREGMRASSRSGLGTSAGPGRQVGDRSYYIGLLRPKNTELTTQIEKLTAQEQEIVKNSAVLTQLQQRTKLITDEITQLKGTLADVNLAVENAQSRDVKAVRDEFDKVDKQNVQKRKKVDALFLSVKEAEAKTKSIESALDTQMQKLDRRVLKENQDYLSYKQVRDESFAIADAVLARQHELRTLAARQELIVHNLTNDPDKKRAVTLLRNILRKRREKLQLTRQCALSVQEEKQQLIKQVKMTRSDIEALERQVNDARDAAQESKLRLNGLDEQMKNYTSDNVKVYQQLKEKDNELQLFINEYPDRDRAEMEKISEAQGNIASLLTRISQALELQRQMPAENSPNALRALNSEVDARRDQIRNDQKTHERLERQLLQRKNELNKVASLDKKIKDELQSQTAKMDQQRKQITQYADLDGLKSNVEKLRLDLMSQKVHLTRVRDGGKAQLGRLSSLYEEDRKKLQENTIHSSLASQEQKLRALWQSTFTLEDFVRLKQKETQYLSTKANCLRIVDEINLMLKDPERIAGRSGPPMVNVR